MPNLVFLLILQTYTESVVGYSEVPGQSHDTQVLKNVNKLRESLLKCPNTVIFDDQIQVSFFCVDNKLITILGLSHRLVYACLVELIVLHVRVLSCWSFMKEALCLYLFYDSDKIIYFLSTKFDTKICAILIWLSAVGLHASLPNELGYLKHKVVSANFHCS